MSSLEEDRGLSNMAGMGKGKREGLLVGNGQINKYRGRCNIGFLFLPVTVT